MRTKHKNRGTSIKLDDRTRDKLDAAAKARGLSRSDMIRDAIRGALDICPTCGQECARGTRRKQVAA